MKDDAEEIGQVEYGAISARWDSKTDGTPMGVRDVVAEAGSLAADIAVGSHGALLAFVVVVIAVTSGR